jgi:amino acid transporter
VLHLKKSAHRAHAINPTRRVDGLAIAGNAPSIFKKTLRNGLPVTAIAVSSSFSLLAFMGVHSGSGKVFNWFSQMTADAGLMTWFGISYTYIRFYAGMKAQGIDRKTLPFSSPLQPYAAWYGAVGTIVVCFVRVLIRSEHLSTPFQRVSRKNKYPDS